MHIDDFVEEWTVEVYASNSRLAARECVKLLIRALTDRHVAAIDRLVEEVDTPERIGFTETCLMCRRAIQDENDENNPVV